ncbi:MAG: 50S ribosomal protein L4 [Clostridia bacterium]
MPKVAVYNMQGQQVEEMELNDAIFDTAENISLVHSVVVMQLANRRAGTQSTKTRAEVRGGGRKPWKQKGTGRASFGSSRNPVWRSGGIAHGPKPRSYQYAMPKKARRIALKSVLSAKLRGGNIVVVDKLEFAAPKTKNMVAVLSALNVTRQPLVVLDELNDNTIKSMRNIEGLESILAANLNVYDALRAHKLIITKNAIAKIEEVLA